MQYSLRLDIHDHLAGYLAHETTLSEFEDWFVLATWDRASSELPETAELIGEIELRLAEHSNGHRTEDDLRQCLLPLVRLVVAGSTGYQTSSSSTTTTLTTLTPVFQFAGALS